MKMIGKKAKLLNLHKTTLILQEIKNDRSLNNYKDVLTKVE